MSSSNAPKFQISVFLKVMLAKYTCQKWKVFSYAEAASIFSH